MKAVTIYKCELCGNVFNDAYRAIECEKKHIKFAECIDTKYSHGSKYPEAIYVRMEDDAFVKYVRDES